MSALLCCGPVFEQEALRGGRYIYRWLENMLCSQEEKVYSLLQYITAIQLYCTQESIFTFLYLISIS